MVYSHAFTTWSSFSKQLVDLNRVHENIIIIGDLSETHRRPIGDPSETDMPHRRPIGDRHASSETDMPHRRPIRNTYLASLRVQNCFILHH